VVERLWWQTVSFSCIVGCTTRPGAIKGHSKKEQQPPLFPSSSLSSLSCLCSLSISCSSFSLSLRFLASSSSQKKCSVGFLLLPSSGSRHSVPITLVSHHLAPPILDRRSPINPIISRIGGFDQVDRFHICRTLAAEKQEGELLGSLSHIISPSVSLGDSTTAQVRF
jgi:hypothetical protein